MRPDCLILAGLIVLAGPAVVANDSHTDLVSLADLFATLREAVGEQIPFGVQGRSLWPMLAGAAYPAEEFDSVYAEQGFGGLPYRPTGRSLHFPYDGARYDELNAVTQSGTTVMLRHGPWKLIYDVTGRGELYDLREDPMELRDRWHDPLPGDVRAALLERLLWWRIRVTDDLPAARYAPPARRPQLVRATPTRVGLTAGGLTAAPWRAAT